MVDFARGVAKMLVSGLPSLAAKDGHGQGPPGRFYARLEHISAKYDPKPKAPRAQKRSYNRVPARSTIVPPHSTNTQPHNRNIIQRRHRQHNATAHSNTHTHTTHACMHAPR